MENPAVCEAMVCAFECIGETMCHGVQGLAKRALITERIATAALRCDCD